MQCLDKLGVGEAQKMEEKEEEDNSVLDMLANNLPSIRVSGNVSERFDILQLEVFSLRLADPITVLWAEGGRLYWTQGSNRSALITFYHDRNKKKKNPKNSN